MAQLPIQRNQSLTRVHPKLALGRITDHEPEWAQPDDDGGVDGHPRAAGRLSMGGDFGELCFREAAGIFLRSNFRAEPWFY